MFFVLQNYKKMSISPNFLQKKSFFRRKLVTHEDATPNIIAVLARTRELSIPP